MINAIFLKFTDKGIDEAYTPPGNDAYTPPGMDVSDDEDKDDAPKTTETPVKEFKLPAKFKDVEFSKKSSKTVNEFNIDTTKSFFDPSGPKVKESKKTPEKSKETKPTEPAKAFGLKIRSMASLQEVKKEVIESAPTMDVS